MTSGTSADDAGVTPPKTDSGTTKDSGTADSSPPVASTFSVGGTVTGMTGAGLVLQNEGGDDLAVAADGTFTFAKKLKTGAAFEVTVKTQPNTPPQTCTVSGGTGTIAAGDVTSVTVNCTPNKYSVGGTATGVAGTGLVLQNNAGDDLTVNANGTFAFKTTLLTGAAYAVTIKTQPTNPSQTCTLTGDTGNVAAANVTSVAVTCTTNKYKVGGTTTGLLGGGLVLTNKGVDDLAVAAPGGPFTFATSIASGITYAVAVKAQPTVPSQTCAVNAGAGTVGGVNVTTVDVACTTNTYKISGTISGLNGGSAVLQNNAGDNLNVAADGAFTFLTKIASGAKYAVTALTSPALRGCSVTAANGTVAAADVTDVVVTCTPITGGQVGPDYGAAGYSQCAGYLDKAGQEDIPNSGWADNCKIGTSLRIVCGANAGAVRYIDVKKNVFALGLASYPESGLITNASFAPIDNVIYASGNQPNSGTSWWNGGDGCNESSPNITINNGCPWEASNCFGQGLAGDRFLYVYTKP